MRTGTLRQVAAAAALAAAASASGQPEYLRLDPGGNGNGIPWMDVDGDILAWSETPGPPHTGMTTHIWRRTAAGWTPDAKFYSRSGDSEYGALTVVDGDRVAMRSLHSGLHTWRHDGAQWREERNDHVGNSFNAGDMLALDGEWMAVPLDNRDRLNHPLAALLYFDGETWRFHSHVYASLAGSHYVSWIELDGDLLGIQVTDASAWMDPSPILLFRRDGNQWRHEFTLPGSAHWFTMDRGRVATRGYGYEEIIIYAESAPGMWDVDSTVAPRTSDLLGLFALDGDALVVTERHHLLPGASLRFGGRALVFERGEAGWAHTRALYPSNAHTMEFGASFAPNMLMTSGPLAHVDDEVFALTADGSPQYKGWRLVGFPACRADFNGDGGADWADLLAFLEGREQGMLSADYDMDGATGRPGSWDEGDFLEFMRALEEGC